MTLLIVTPVRNEIANVEGLVETVRGQTYTDFVWLVVDDGSSDGTAERLRSLDETVQIVSKQNDGGLIGGSAYTSWRFGVETALVAGAFTHIMKLDADVRLAPDYLERVVPLAAGDVGVAGGVIVTKGMREQKLMVPGPVKLYSIEGYRATAGMPSAIGFDVLDEVAVAGAGMRTVVDESARFELARAIGASEGQVHGRYRNGRVSRWTGYFFPYFLVHCARYAFRKPYLVGAFAMLWGYARAGVGPYDVELRRAHSRMQREKLVLAFRNPVSFWRRAYRA